MDTCVAAPCSTSVESLSQTETPATEIPVARRILLAEDNPQDVFLLTEAFLAERISVEIDCVVDGDQLLARLTGLTGDGRESYGLVLLDLHLPRRSAEDVLIALNQQQRRLGMPLVVLTTLISNQEQGRLLSLGVSEIITKPCDLDEYYSLAKKLSSLLV